MATGIEEATRDILVADSTVTGLVSTRIYPQVLPQGATLPAIAYQMVSSAREHAHDGAAQDLSRPRLQWAAHAATYSAAKAVAKAVRDALAYYHGSTGGIKIDAVLFENEIDDFIFRDDEQASTYVVIVDAYVWYHDTIQGD